MEEEIELVLVEIPADLGLRVADLMLKVNETPENNLSFTEALALVLSVGLSYTEAAIYHDGELPEKGEEGQN